MKKNWLRKIWDKIKGISYNDPVKHCPTYKDSGCVHVDGLLCDFPNCGIQNIGRKKKTITVFPHRAFDEFCKRNGLNDFNVGKKTDMAFISIIGTKPCLKYYLDESDTKHHFRFNHHNVLNLEFDDISQDEIEWYGHIFKGMSMKQAEKLFKFIERNINCNFYIHCRAGASRSQGVGNFIYNFYKDMFESDTLLPHPNKDVYRKLSRCFYKKYRPDYE